MVARDCLSALLLSSILRNCIAGAIPWQCRASYVDLNNIYPDLVRKDQDDAILGEGTDGEVILSNSSAKSVLKRFFPESTYPDRIYHEYWVGHSLSHPNIAKTHSMKYVEAGENGYWEMEIEYVPFSLLDLLDYDRWAKRPWTFDAISCFFAKATEAVAHMHEQGIAHRDLKVENILVARDGTVKLIDFGSSAPSRNMVTRARLNSWANWIGTPITMAPEVHGEAFYDMEKADVWSLAVVFVRLWLGVYPWEPQEVVGGLLENEAFLTFVEEKADRTPCTGNEHDDRLLCQIPVEARGVVACMLEIDPRRRIGLHTVLGSRWLRKIVSTAS
ncbi:kinase-like protein [Decorospora gaudefroyi]|uniref:non-specific serine/threonine protein kinase n=1 Tax=Decorospora gaudefroyi TaxID=184978 RepID=A0A6A5KVG4_9PLEO|nr:kinase-like protein [Decorospora gaudefroyi]